MKSILIIEDKKETREILARCLTTDFQIFSAEDQKKGAELFTKHRTDIVGILIGACIPGRIPNTMDLIRQFRQVFTGPIIVVSAGQDLDHLFYPIGVQVVTSKNYAPSKLRQQLKLFAKRSQKGQA